MSVLPLSPLNLAAEPCTGDCPDCRKKIAGTRVLVGVDRTADYGPVLSLLERLAFERPFLDLVHVAPDRAPVAPFFDSPGVEERYAQVVSNLGHETLGQATVRACGKQLPCDARLLHGHPAERLIREAEELGADLIAVNARFQGVNGRSTLGSVSRALAISSPTSVLVAKGEQGRRGAFRAVFATDGSLFAERCLDRFLQLRPKGIEEVVVVSAWDLNDAEAAILGQNLAMLGGDADRVVEERVQTMAQAAASRLEAAGYRARTLVHRGRPNEVIHRAMADVRADLLVVGSEGAGAMSRPIVGSVALHQVTTELYPVLVIRPQEA